MESMTWLSLAPGAPSLSVSIVLDLWTLPLSSRKLSVNENSQEQNDTQLFVRTLICMISLYIMYFTLPLFGMEFCT